MSSGPVVPMVWEGLNAVKTGRVMLGATNPADSAPGTIRGDLCVQVGRNIIHGSDSVESAKKEIALWFNVSCSFHEKVLTQNSFSYLIIIYRITNWSVGHQQALTGFMNKPYLNSQSDQ